MARGRKSKKTQTRSYKKSRKDNFSIYIYKVLKEVHQDIGISKKGMAVMNAMLLDSFDTICLESAKLARYSKRTTIGHQ